MLQSNWTVVVFNNLVFPDLLNLTAWFLQGEQKLILYKAIDTYFLKLLQVMYRTCYLHKISKLCSFLNDLVILCWWFFFQEQTMHV